MDLESLPLALTASSICQAMDLRGDMGGSPTAAARSSRLPRPFAARLSLPTVPDRRCTGGGAWGASQASFCTANVSSTIP